MKTKHKYLITYECNASRCIPQTITQFFTLYYPVNTEVGMRKLLKKLNPKEYLVHLAILFIYDLGSD